MRIFDTLRSLIPAPMAAPEMADLRAQRIRLIVSANATALLCVSFASWSPEYLPYLTLLIAALLVFCSLETLFYLRKKTQLDDAYLARICGFSNGGEEDD